MMQDLKTYSDSMYELKDVRKRECHKYKEANGKHFTKSLCEYAVEHMVNRDGSNHEYTLDDTIKLWRKHNLPDIPKANWHDVVYVINMAYADYYGKLFTNDYECAMYAYLYLSDPDGYEGIAFERWLADIKNSDEDVPWSTVIH